MNYAELAFTESIKKMQEKLGSRNGYARMEKMSYVDGLSDYEIDFIQSQDSFYMASYSENDFPYIQHLGGQRGFIKIIDNTTISIVDFVTNSQHISLGNILKNPKVSLIIVSYPQRARLKIYAEAKIIELTEDDDLYGILNPVDYEFRPKKMMIFHIKAYDWNCPQYITPKYSAEEIQGLFETQKQHISDLEKKIAELKEKL